MATLAGCGKTVTVTPGQVQIGRYDTLIVAVPPNYRFSSIAQAIDHPVLVYQGPVPNGSAQNEYKFLAINDSPWGVGITFAPLGLAPPICQTNRCGVGGGLVESVYVVN